MIKALYVVSDGGIPLYHFSPTTSDGDDTTDALLFSGLITAIKSFMIEVNVGEPQKFSTKTSEVYLEATKCFGVVLLKDFSDKSTHEEVQELVSTLVRRLAKKLSIRSSCEYLSNEEREILKKIIDEEMENWNKKMSEDKSISKMKKGFW